MSATPEQLVGKTIEAVRTVDMAGRDTYKDWVTWTRTEITFTDGTVVSFSDSDGEVYDAFEYAGIDPFGEPIPVGGVHIDLSNEEPFPCKGCGINLYMNKPNDGVLTCPVCGHQESV